MFSRPVDCNLSLSADLIQQRFPAAKVRKCTLGKAMWQVLLVSKTGVVVPTLGTRQAYLEQCLESISEQGFDAVCIVCPSGAISLSEKWSGITVLDDPGTGPAGAMNRGFEYLLDFEKCEIVAWLGDDDFYMPGSLRVSTQLMAEEGASVVVGRCQYIDQENKVIYEASPTPMNVQLLEYWSNKLP
jgi:glycosyltransferase involved in cell wall biosynthesis